MAVAVEGCDNQLWQWTMEGGVITSYGSGWWKDVVTDYDSGWWKDVTDYDNGWWKGVINQYLEFGY